MGRKRISDEAALEAMRSAGYEPLTPYPGISKPWPAKCRGCGEERRPTLQNILYRSSRCKVCDARRRGDSARYSNEEASSQMARRGAVPLEPYPGATSPWRFKCASCGSEHAASLNRVKATWRCSHCKRGDRERRQRALVAKHGWEPLEPLPSGSRLWKCRHQCGYVHSLHFSGLGRYGDGCPECASSGFKVSERGWIYLLRLPGHGALKVGITNNLRERLTRHAAVFAETEVLQLAGPIPGGDAAAGEKAILTAWRSAGYVPLDTLASLSGGTETAPETPETVAAALEVIESLTPIPTFDPATFRVAECGQREARRLVAAGHYTGSLPVAGTLIGLFGPDDALLGVASFGTCSYPGVPRSVYPSNPSGVVELRRLYVVDQCGPNAESWFLARAIKLLPRSVECVVAFSDPSAGHYGGCYQASNFRFTGMTAASYHYTTPDGKYQHKRLPWNRARANGTDEATEASLMGLVRTEDPAKYRYAYPRSRRARVEILALPYPKPSVA